MNYLDKRYIHKPYSEVQKQPEQRLTLTKIQMVRVLGNPNLDKR